MSNVQTILPKTSTDTGLLVVALCGAESRSNSIVIDRKFHEGMLGFVERLDLPTACLLPQLTPAEARSSMDMVEVPREDLPYRINLLEPPLLSPQNARFIERTLDGTTIVMLGALDDLHLAVASECRRRAIPYVLVSEYTLQTELQIMRVATSSILRRGLREMKIRLGRRRASRTIAAAAEIHANGYPTFQELAAANPHRILFFDTRAKGADIIPESELRQRLALRTQRPARLIFSGRYHPMKGVLDVVKVALELDRRGLSFQLDMYGTGPLRQQMESMVREVGGIGKILIHDAIPFRPDLQLITRQADLFVCCHPQGDPSCTYLETFASGVPIAGYANEMWLPLCEDSGGGDVVEVGNHQALAATVIRLLGSTTLEEQSLRARAFAARHTMEVAWDLRASRLGALADTSLKNAR